MKNENKNIKKRGLKKALLTAGLIASLALTGCDIKIEGDINNKQESLLEDTIFDKSVAALVDNNPTILKKEKTNYNYEVYKDIVNGELITTYSEGINRPDLRTVSEIDVQGSIFNYLTEEDINKLRNKEFTKEDENRIICQIRDEIKKQQEEKSATKTK